jgi:hypothetical protein
MNALRKGTTPAMVVACAAMAFALVGTAVAANDGTIYPKLSKSKVKKIAKKQADAELRANVSGSRVNLADEATTAGTVNGQTPHKIFVKVASGGASSLEFNGLTLRVGCAGGQLQFTATTAVDDAIFASNVQNGVTSGGVRSSDFDTGDTLNVISDLLRGGGSFTYSQPGGSYITGTFAADDSTTFGTFAGCVVVGTAFTG